MKAPDRCPYGHLRSEHGRPRKDLRKGGTVHMECCACRREKSAEHRASWGPTTATGNATRALWADNAAEYWFMRHELGMTVRQVAEAVGLSRGAMEMGLYRHVGGKAQW